MRFGKRDRQKLNVPLAFASIFLSVILWAVVYPQTQGPIDTKRFLVHLDKDGPDPSRLVVTKAPPNVQVWITGPAALLDKISSDDIRAVVDLTRATAGKNTYQAVVSLAGSRLRELKWERTRNVEVTLETISKRSMPIEVEFTGALSDDNLVVEQKILDPSTVVISGPKSEVDNVSAVRALLDLGAVDVANPRPQAVGLEPVPESSSTPLEQVNIHPPTVRITPVLNAAPEEKLLFVLPTIVGQAAPGYVVSGYEIAPNPVQVRGRGSALASISKVRSTPIDISGTKVPTTFECQLLLPAGVEMIKPTKVQVRVLIQAAPTPKPPVGSGAGKP